MVAESADVTEPARRLPTARRPPWFRRHPRTAIALVASGLTLVLDFATANVLRVTGLVRFDRPDAHYRTLHPTYSHALRPRIACAAQWGAARYPMRTNSLGFRDGAVREVALAAAGPRVLLIGDSFTEGIGVTYEDSFAGLLAHRLGARGIEVLNAGCASYSPWVYDRKVRHLVNRDGVVFDHLVVCIDASDIVDELGRLAAPDPTAGPAHHPIEVAWKAYVHEHSVLFGAAAVLLRWVRGVADQARAADWRAALDRPRCRWAIDDAEFARSAAGVEAARMHMDRLATFVRERGIPLTVVVYPWPDFVALGTGGHHVSLWRDWCAAHNVRFVDCCPRFFDAAATPQATIAQAFIAGDVHFNPAGHRLVAECIEAALPEQVVSVPR